MNDRQIEESSPDARGLRWYFRADQVELRHAHAAKIEAAVRRLAADGPVRRSVGDRIGDGLEIVVADDGGNAGEPDSRWRECTWVVAAWGAHEGRLPAVVFDVSITWSVADAPGQRLQALEGRILDIWAPADPGPHGGRALDGLLRASTANALDRAGVTTVKQLAWLTPQWVSYSRGIGPGSVRELVDTLTGLGIEWGRESARRSSTGLRWIEADDGGLFELDVDWETTQRALHLAHGEEIVRALRVLAAAGPARRGPGDRLADHVELVRDGTGGRRTVALWGPEPRTRPTVVLHVTLDWLPAANAPRPQVHAVVHGLWAPLDAGRHGDRPLSGVLTPQATRALESVGISTLGRLLWLSPAMARDVDGVGQSAMTKLRAEMARLGIDWGDTSRD